MSNRRKAFETPYQPEAKYVSQLRKIAEGVNQIIASFPQDKASLPAMEHALNAYNRAIQPWAATAAFNMLRETRKVQQRQWQAAMPRVNTIAAYDKRWHPNGKKPEGSIQATAVQPGRLDRKSGRTYWPVTK